MYINAYVNCKSRNFYYHILSFPIHQNPTVQLRSLWKQTKRRKWHHISPTPRDQSTSDPHNKTVRNPNRTIYQQRNCVLSYNSPLANNTVSSHFRASFLLKLSKEPRKRERRKFMESTYVGRKVFNPLLFYAVKPIHQTSLMLSAIIQAAIK